MITESDFKLDSAQLTFYHDKFKYKMSIWIKGIHHFRTTKSIYEYSQRVDEYYINRMYYNDINSIISDTNLLKPIENLVIWRSTIIEKNLNFKLRFGENKITIYANDFTVFELLLTELKYSKDDTIISYNYSEPMTNHERGVIYQTEPKRKFRIYMKQQLYTTEQREKLYDYLSRYDITMSPSMTKWITGKSSSQIFVGMHNYNLIYSWDNYFFDFDQESLITLLSLKFDNLIRKVCTIQKR
jgi:hypothetical protein